MSVLVVHALVASLLVVAATVAGVVADSVLAPRPAGATNRLLGDVYRTSVTAASVITHLPTAVSASPNELSTDANVVGSRFLASAVGTTGGPALVLQDLSATPPTFHVANLAPGGTVADGTVVGERLSGNGRYLVWSSDSTDQLASSAGVRAVYRYDMVTDSVIKVSAIGAVSGDSGITGSDVSDDGNIVVFALTRSGTNYVEVVNVSAGTRTEVALAGTSPTVLRVSPDGEWLAMLGSGNYSGLDLYDLGASSPSWHTINNGYWYLYLGGRFDIGFNGQSTKVYSRPTYGHSNQLVEVTLSTLSTRDLPITYADAFDVNGDGTRIAYEQSGQVYLYEDKSQGSFPVSSDSFLPAISSEGSHLAFGGYDCNTLTMCPPGSTGGTNGAAYRMHANWGSSDGLDAANKAGGHNPSMLCLNCQVHQEQTTSWPVDASTGNFWHTFADLALPGHGRTLGLSHTYNSLFAGRNGPMGYGWTFDWNMSLAVNSTTGVVTFSQENGSEVRFLPDPENLGDYVQAPWVTASLVKHSGGSFTVVRNQLETIDFDSAGKVTQITDPTGYITTVAYGYTSSVLTSMTITQHQDVGATGSPSQAIVLTVSGGHVTAATDPIGRTVTFAYDGSGDLVSFTDLRGQTTTLTYASHLLTKITDPLGEVTRNDYDTSTPPRVIRQWSPLGLHDTTNDYRASSTPPTGRATQFDYSVTDETSITDPAGDVEVQTYLDGYLLSDTFGAGTGDVAAYSYEHDPYTGGVTKATDPNGAYTVTNWFYDCTGLTGCFPNRLSDTQSFDATDTAVAPATTYTYTANGLPDTVTDPENVTTTYAYEADDVTVASVSYPSDAGTVTTTYHHSDTDHPGDVTSVTDPNGQDWEFTLNDFGQVTDAEDPESNVTTTHYDDVGRPTWSVSPKGTAGTPGDYRSTVLYGDGGEPIVAGGAVGKTISDGFNRADGGIGTAESTQSWTNTSGTWSVDGRRAELSTAAGGSAANLASVTVSSADMVVGATATTTADGSGVFFRGSDATHYWKLVARPSSGYWQLQNVNGATTTTLGNTGASTCCTNGQHLQVRTSGTSIKVFIDGVLKLTVTSSTFSTNTNAGLFAETTGGVFDDFYAAATAGAPSVSAYDANGRLAWSQDPNGNRSAASYDADGNAVGSTRPDGSTVGFAFDLNGRRTSYTDGLTNTTTWAYDHLGRPSSETAPGKNPTTFAYAYADATYGGLTETITQPSGKTVTQHFDTRGLLMETEYDNTGPATPDVTYGYDDDGRQTSMTSSTSSTTWAYDDAGRLTSSTRGLSPNQKTVGYTYDLGGNLDHLTYPGSNVVDYDYDDAGRMTSADDWANSAVTFDWDANSNLHITHFPNGVDTTRTYDPGDRPTVISIDNSGGNIQTFTQTYDSNSQVTQVATSPTLGYANYNYSYDANSRLTGGPDGGGGTYDAGDNPLKPGGRNQGFNAANELCWNVGGTVASNACGTIPSGATTYDYDDNGNRTDREPPSGSTANRYEYDQANRLVAFKTSTNTSAPFTYTGNTATYVYDGDGLRLSKTVGALTTRYAWDESGSLPMMLTDNTDNYIYGPLGEATTRIPATGTSTFIHQDHLGSTRILTDNTGTKSGYYNYGPWGRQTGNGTAAVNLRYAAEYYDSETQFTYLRARYYDPFTAQFMTVDPIASSTLDRYGYGGSDPLNSSDPSGLDDNYRWDGHIIAKWSYTLSNRVRLTAAVPGVVVTSNGPGAGLLREYTQTVVLSVVQEGWRTNSDGSFTRVRRRFHLHFQRSFVVEDHFTVFGTYSGPSVFNYDPWTFVGAYQTWQHNIPGGCVGRVPDGKILVPLKMRWVKDHLPTTKAWDPTMGEP